MITCNDFTDLLSAYIADELPPAQRAAVDSHLRRCEDCSRELKTQRLILHLARTLPDVPPPHHLLQRFKQALQGKGRTPPRQG